ncbi:MAG: phosphotransferase, partial [Chloroflexota bacterium]|nr:phosphotransferase [Chloroflexota bacterium]
MRRLSPALFDFDQEDASMTRFFPAQSSILDAAALAARILPLYDLPPPLSCRLLQAGDNDTYLVHAGGPTSPERRRYALRVYRHAKHSAREIQGEVDVLALMARSGIAVAPAIAQRDGSCIGELNAPEGTRYAVLFAFAGGALAGFDMTPEQSHRYGQQVARLHAVVDAAPETFPRPSIDLSFLLDRPLDRLSQSFPHRQGEVSAVRSLARHLRKTLEALPATAPQFGLCHGDLHKRNVLFDERNEPIILDWDCAGYGWRAYDVAVLLWSTALQGLGTALWDAYLAGYQEPQGHQGYP